MLYSSIDKVKISIYIDISYWVEVLFKVSIQKKKYRYTLSLLSPNGQIFVSANKKSIRKSILAAKNLKKLYKEEAYN